MGVVQKSRIKQLVIYIPLVIYFLLTGLSYGGEPMKYLVNDRVIFIRDRTGTVLETDVKNYWFAWPGYRILLDDGQVVWGDDTDLSLIKKEDL